MTSERIEEIQKQTAYPDSQSVHQALLQVWNEAQQDNNKRIGSCKDCEYLSKKGLCKLHSEDSSADVIMMDDDFCSYFKRREK